MVDVPDRRDRDDADRDRRRGRDRGRGWAGPDFTITRLECSKAVWESGVARSSAVAEVKYRRRHTPNTTLTVVFRIKGVERDHMTTDSGGVASVDLVFLQAGSYPISAEIEGIDGTRIYTRLDVPPDPEKDITEIGKMRRKVLVAGVAAEKIEKDIALAEAKKRRETLAETPPPQLRLLGLLPNSDGTTATATLLRTRKGKPEAGPVFYSDPDPTPIGADQSGVARIVLELRSRARKVFFFLPENPDIRIEETVPAKLSVRQEIREGAQEKSLAEVAREAWRRGKEGKPFREKEG